MALPKVRYYVLDPKSGVKVYLPSDTDGVANAVERAKEYAQRWRTPVDVCTEIKVAQVSAPGAGSVL